MLFLSRTWFADLEQSALHPTRAVYILFLPPPTPALTLPSFSLICRQNMGELAQILHRMVVLHLLISLQPKRSSFLFFFLLFFLFFSFSNKSHLCPAMLWAVQRKGAQWLLPQPVCCRVHGTSGERLPGKDAAASSVLKSLNRGTGRQLNVLQPSSIWGSFWDILTHRMPFGMGASHLWNRQGRGHKPFNAGLQ